MNWGNKIILVFVLFAGMISYMVYRCIKLPVDLVSDEYYKDELAYQQVIDGTKRANALSGRVELAHAGSGFILTMPAEMRHRPVLGNIFFYCPADASRDRTIPLLPDAMGAQWIPANAIPKGRYRLKISWETQGVSYYAEQNLYYQ
ncbi:MAG TPA: FixH family protein [Puia sp.]|nr:FixH family protein [Puia sp.]